jgi:hypothetical protein
MFDDFENDFKDWADWMYSLNGGGRNRGYEKHSLLTDFLFLYPKHRSYLTMKFFKQRIVLYCEAKGLMFNPHKMNVSDRRDKANGLEFYFVCDSRFDAGAKLERLHMQRAKRKTFKK